MQRHTVEQIIQLYRSDTPWACQRLNKLTNSTVAPQQGAGQYDFCFCLGTGIIFGNGTHQGIIRIG